MSSDGDSCSAVCESASRTFCSRFCFPMSRPLAARLLGKDAAAASLPLVCWLRESACRTTILCSLDRLSCDRSTGEGISLAI